MAKKPVASDIPEETAAPVASEEVKSEVTVVEPKPVEPAEEPKKVLSKVHVPVGSKAEAMKLKLAAEPKVRILVPLASGEKPGVTQSVILNGYPMYIRKGEYVNVPESVAEVLEIKMKHKMSVDNHPLKATGTGEVKMDVY